MGSLISRLTLSLTSYAKIVRINCNISMHCSMPCSQSLHWLEPNFLRWLCPCYGRLKHSLLKKDSRGTFSFCQTVSASFFKSHLSLVFSTITSSRYCFSEPTTSATTMWSKSVMFWSQTRPAPRLHPSPSRSSISATTRWPRTRWVILQTCLRLTVRLSTWVLLSATSKLLRFRGFSTRSGEFPSPQSR